MEKTRPKVFTPKFMRLFSLLLFLSAPSVLFAQTVAAWLAKPSNVAVYGTIAPEVNTMVQQLEKLGLSDSILVVRLEEGAQKQVNPEILVASLRVDIQRVVRLAAILRANGIFPSNRNTASSAIEQMLIFIRAGLTEAEVRNALEEGVAKSGAKQKATARALAALSVVTSAKAQFGLGEEDRLRLASVLIASDLDEDGFGSILVSVEEFTSAGHSAAEAVSKALEKVSLSGKKNQGDISQNAEGQSDSGKPQSGKSESGGQGNQGGHGKK